MKSGIFIPVNVNDNLQPVNVVFVCATYWQEMNHDVCGAHGRANGCLFVCFSFIHYDIVKYMNEFIEEMKNCQEGVVYSKKELY